MVLELSNGNTRHPSGVLKAQDYKPVPQRACEVDRFSDCPGKCRQVAFWKLLATKEGARDGLTISAPPESASAGLA